MDTFELNGYLWRVYFVNPNSPELIDRTGVERVATTDPVEKIIFLSTELSGDFLERVLRHELSHAIMLSYHLLPEIHRMVHPYYWIEAEEWICNYIADYSPMLLRTVDRILNAL